MGQKPDAWMPLYLADYKADTARLFTEQHGAYLLILMDYWRNGPPPDDDAVLAQITGLPLARWRKHRPVIERLFQVSGGVWKHKRVEKELNKAREVQAALHERAIKGADARWGKDSSDDASSNASGIPSDSAQAMPDAVLADAPSPSPTPNTPAPKTTDTDNQVLVRASRLPQDWALPDEWAQWAMQDRNWSAGQVLRVAEGFRDFWIGKAGKDARKVDWEATWRNWVRNQRAPGTVADQNRQAMNEWLSDEKTIEGQRL